MQRELDGAHCVKLQYKVARGSDQGATRKAQETARREHRKSSREHIVKGAQGEHKEHRKAPNEHRKAPTEQISEQPSTREQSSETVGTLVSRRSRANLWFRGNDIEIEINTGSVPVQERKRLKIHACYMEI